MNNLKPFGGIHHVTAITSSAEKIYAFYTNILGMRLVKKNVNQDDLETYHLFFADDRGNPGTDMTFFDFKGIGPHVEGTNDIARTGFRVASDEALRYWIKRFDHYNIAHSAILEHFNRKYITFEDFDHQHYALYSDENLIGVLPGEPWHKGPVPDEYAIIGLGPISLTVDNEELIDLVLKEVLQMHLVGKEDNQMLYEMGPGGNGGSVLVTIDSESRVAQQGFGGVHHVAFRVDDLEHLNEWQDTFDSMNLPNSGFVERFYFASVYIRLYPNILFELATDGPGFIDDQEDYETLGGRRTLPPHLRKYQNYVEQHLEDFDTIRSTKHFEKEYYE